NRQYHQIGDGGRGRQPGQYRFRFTARRVQADVMGVDGIIFLELGRFMDKRILVWKGHSGFTIMELMTGVVIIGILTSVALPSYQEQLRKSRRSDARITLENLAAAQEIYYFQHHNYAEKFSDIRMVADSLLALPSEHGL